LAITNFVGEWIQEEEDIFELISNGFRDIYTSLLTSLSKAMPSLSQWHDRLNEEEKESVGGQVTVDEIRTTL